MKSHNRVLYGPDDKGNVISGNDILHIIMRDDKPSEPHKCEDTLQVMTT